MCAEACLALRMCSPMQSWGVDSRFNRRNTASMPSRSAVCGMLCAALGLSRGSEEEQSLLKELSSVRMTALNVQKKKNVPASVEDAFLDSITDSGAQDDRQPRFPMRRMQDYHTVLGTRSAEGNNRFNAVLTYRQYLTDALFFVFLCGNMELVDRLAKAVQDPVWGLWLGRKACIPSLPVYAGTFPTREEAESALLHGFCVLAREEDCASFIEGTDSIPDTPLSFCSADRRFNLRRVKRTY